jgi:outer membrane protein assembly factor BamE (lipoprotein component of BamABCDE complex)
VRFLLGTPIVPGAFDNDRWDYALYVKLRRLQAATQARATVYFRNEVVDHVISDVKGTVAVPLSKRPVSAPGA